MAYAGTDGVGPGSVKHGGCLTITVLNIAGPESAANPIGRINFLIKLAGKLIAGNPHVGFDEAGTGNGPTRHCASSRSTWRGPLLSNRPG